MLTELVPGVHWLDLGYVNAYLVEDGDDLVLCDAGFPWSAFAIEDRLAALGYDPSDVDRVLLTHFDLDHVGALSALDLDAPVYAGGFDASLLLGDARPPLTNHKGLLQRGMGRFVDLPSLPISEVADGDPIGSFTAYHTPGHTPGHVAWVSESMDVALLGDLVVESDGELEPSPWIVSYDTGQVRTSIDSLAERAPAFGAACVGHGEPLDEGGWAALPLEPTPGGGSGVQRRLRATASRVEAGANLAKSGAGRAKGAAARVRAGASRVKGAASRIR